MSEATAPAPDPAPDPDAVPDYEQARDELASTVAALEAGGLSLEASLALWERGEALARVCERHLAGARERVESALERARSVGTPESVDGAHPAESMRDTREP